MGASAPTALRFVALVSGLYDLAAGLALWAGRDRLAVWVGLVPATPSIYGDLVAVFLLTIAVGYIGPYRDPVRYRVYLWLMGPVLKGAGAGVFLADYLTRSAPPIHLLFAASDAALALVTLAVLVRTRQTAAAPPR